MTLIKNKEVIFLSDVKCALYLVLLQHAPYKESDLKSLSPSQLVRVHFPLSLVTTIQTTPAPINQYKHT